MTVKEKLAAMKKDALAVVDALNREGYHKEAYTAQQLVTQVDITETQLSQREEVASVEA